MFFYTIPKLVKLSNGLQILDMMPLGYSPKYVNDLFVALGEIGRNIYLTQQIPLDMFYPGLFALSFSLLLSFLLKKAFVKKSIMQKAFFLPIFAGLFDYAENIGIILMLKIYPLFHPKLAMITSIFSILKSVTYTITMCVLIYTIIVLVIKKNKKKFS